MPGVLVESGEFDELMRVQRNMAGRLRRENEMERKIALLSLIQALNPDKRGRILTEQIVVAAGDEGFSESEVDALLDELEADGYLRRVEMGIMMLL